jgi:hypothetical protein
MNRWMATSGTLHPQDPRLCRPQIYERPPIRSKLGLFLPQIAGAGVLQLIPTVHLSFFRREGQDRANADGLRNLTIWSSRHPLVHAASSSLAGISQQEANQTTATRDHKQEITLRHRDDRQASHHRNGEATPRQSTRSIRFNALARSSRNEQEDRKPTMRHQ